MKRLLLCCAMARHAAAWVPFAPRWRALTALGSQSTMDNIDFEDGMGDKASANEAPMPTVEEARAGADKYDKDGGPAIDNPYYMHPDTLPVLHEWTAEDYTADYAAAGATEWVVPTEAWVFRRVVKDAHAARGLRQALHLDHLFWARESGIVANRAGPDADAPRVHAAQCVLDDSGYEVAESLIAVVGGDGAAAAALVAADPLVKAGVFDVMEGYHWAISGDEYLQVDVWPEGQFPYLMLRLDDAAGAAKRGPTREKHLSFLRKTRRTIRAGPLRPIEGAKNDAPPVGSLVYSFHSNAAAAAAWAAADPYATAGVFPPGKPDVLAAYCDLDVTGTEITRPEPLNELPDPLLARLVDAGLVALEERVVDRIDPDEDGSFTRYNVTTNDPRVQTNVDVDDEMMAAFASTPKALRAKRARDKAEALEAEEEENLNVELE